MRQFRAADLKPANQDHELGSDLGAAAHYFAARLAFEIDCVCLWKRLSGPDRSTVIDVRSARSYAHGHIPGAISRPSGLMEAGAPRAGSPVYVCGSGGDRGEAYAAALAFVLRGIPAKVVTGGFATWAENGFEIERSGLDPGEMSAV